MKKIILSALVIATMTSCSKNEIIPTNDSIHFGRSQIGNSTKAGEITDITGGDLLTSGFQTAAYLNVGGGEIIPSVLVKEAAGKWNYTGDYYWPVDSDAKVDFYSIGPMNTPKTFSDPAFTATEVSTTITVDADATKHEDLLYAFNQTTRTASGTSGVATTFNHTLSRVSFTGYSDIASGVTIDKVELTGINSVGTFTGSKDATPAATVAWSAQGTPINYAFDLTGSKVDISGTPTTHPAVGTYFLLVPQTIPTAAKLKVTITINGITSVKSIDLNTLATTAWTAKTAYNYDLQILAANSRIEFAAPSVDGWGTPTSVIVEL